MASPRFRRSGNRSRSMSRQLSRENGTIKEIIKNADECVWLYDEVCCNADSEYVADFPMDYCRKCKHFTKECRECHT